MNRYAAYPHKVPGYPKWWAMIRLCRDAKAAPVFDEDGSPKKFDTKGEAAEECLLHVMAYMNGREIRGEVFESGDYTRSKVAKSLANEIFRSKEAAA